MKEQFVSYDLAKKLEELGFNEPCLAYYCEDIIRYDGKKHEYITHKYITPDEYEEVRFSKRIKSVFSPLWQQVIDWLRERYNCNIILTQSPHNGCWIYTLEGIEDNKPYSLFRSYPIAREMAILRIIELINVKHQ